MGVGPSWVGLVPLEKWRHRAPLLHPPYEDAATVSLPAIHKRALTRTTPRRQTELGLLASRTVRSKCLLFTSHRVWYSVLATQWAKTALNKDSSHYYYYYSLLLHFCFSMLAPQFLNAKWQSAAKFTLLPGSPRHVSQELTTTPWLPGTIPLLWWWWGTGGWPPHLMVMTTVIC